MIRVNENFEKIQSSYLFANISKKVSWQNLQKKIQIKK